MKTKWSPFGLHFSWYYAACKILRKYSYIYNLHENFYFCFDMLKLCPAVYFGGGGKEGIEPQFFQDAHQKDMREEPGVAEAFRAVFLDLDMIGFSRFLVLAVGLKGGDQGRSSLKGFFQPFNIVRLMAIKMIQWPNVENNLLLRHLLGGSIGNPHGLD